jgi:phosphate starvation-inducible PhoH-like protein
LKKNNKRSSKRPRVVDATNEIVQQGAAYRNRLKPRSENQKEYIRSIAENHITFCQGAAGSGKTHCAIGLALEYLLDDKVKKIIITRPIVESGEKIGYLPGPQPLDAKILTPSGWVLMGDIKVGDMVISRDGFPTKVLGVFPKGIKKVYKITTTDGRTTECCEDHLWFTHTSIDRKRKQNGSIKTTKEISLSLLNDKNKVNHFLPINEPVHFIQQNLPMPAYSLGVLLGDGSLSNSITFSNIDNELIDKVSKEMAILGCYCVKESPDRISYNIRSNLYNKKIAKKVCITNSHTGNITKYSSVGIASQNLGINSNTLQARCRRTSTIEGLKYSFEKPNKKYTNPAKQIIYSLGILGKKAINKSIPNIYKYSSIIDRLELLRGLMDTDGSVKKRTGEASFCTISKQLAQDVVELVQSLGGKAKLRSRNRIGKTTSILKKDNRHIISRHIVYECNIGLPKDMNPFYISRKAEKYKNNFMQGIGVANISEVGDKPVQCIRVENPEHLYITDNYIVTHNTAEEKIHPYLLPILDEVNHFISTAQYTSLKLNNKIEIVPLGLMRGRNFNNCFIVADECQNASYEQLKMLITRLGKDSKMVLTGDIGQSDLQRHLQGGFLEMIEQLETIEGIAVARLQFSDIVRNPIIAKILVRLDAYENETTKQ